MAAKPAKNIKNNVQPFPVAHSLRDAANSGNTLQGYAAMNDPQADSEISQVAATEQPSGQEPFDEYREVSLRAYELYQARNGENGSAENDWFRAEQDVRARRVSTK